VLYIRGDEWDAVTAAIPDPARARCVRFWPGATWVEGVRAAAQADRPADRTLNSQACALTLDQSHRLYPDA
jgi:hypothetical protein